MLLAVGDVVFQGGPGRDGTGQGDTHEADGKNNKHEITGKDYLT